MNKTILVTGGTGLLETASANFCWQKDLNIES